MVAIPRSQGVEQGRTTETGLRPQSIAQSQVVPNAFAQLGEQISNLGFQEIQRQAIQERKEQEEYQTSQVLDARNKLRSFDNSSSIALKELPDDQETINSYKQKALEERELLFEELNQSFEGDKKLQRLLKDDYQTSKVAFEYGIDQELSRKRKNYNTNKLYESISALKDRFETASSDVDFLQIRSDLDTTLQFGLSSGIVDARDIDRQQDAFRALAKERKEELTRESIFNQAIQGNIRLDATDADDRSLIDANYSDAVLKGADPVQLADDLAINQGIIPKQAKKTMSALLFNGSPTQKLESALRIENLVKNNVSLQNQFSNKELALSTAIANRYEAGLPIDKVIEFAENEIKENKSQDVIFRQQKFNTEYAQNGKKWVETVENLGKELRGTTGFLGFGKAEVPKEMSIELRNLAQDYYLNEGVDIDAAFDAAKTRILGNWAVTNIGEKRFQKFAPEVFYGEGKWIQNQAIQAVRKLTVDPLPNIKDEIRLQPIVKTIPTGAPSYNVFTEKDGLITPVLDENNQPLVFKPDPKKTPEYKEMQESIQKLKLTPEREWELLDKRNTKKEKSKIIFGHQYKL